MSLTLIKTTAPKCKCGSEHFIKIGIAWNCSNCGAYVAAKLEKNKTIDALKADVNKLQNLHKELKTMIAQVEGLISK